MPRLGGGSQARLRDRDLMPITSLAWFNPLRILILLYTMCIVRCMRTNIVLNDDLVREAMRYSKAKTKRALVEDALLTLVRVRSEERRRETYLERLASLERRLAGIRLRESPLDLLRQDRVRR